MSKTIKQIADELGVSRQAVHQKIKRNKDLSTCLQTFTSTVDGVVYISVDGENLIKSAFEKNKRKQNDLNVDSDKLTVGLQSIIDILQKEIETFKLQLEQKNEMICTLQSDLEREREHSREMASKLATLADQAQKLQLISSSTMIEDKDNLRKKHWWQRKRTQE